MSSVQVSAWANTPQRPTVPGTGWSPMLPGRPVPGECMGPGPVTHSVGDCRAHPISLDISRRAPTSLLTCDDGGEGPHLLVIALVEGSARIVAGQQRCWVPFDNFVRLLMKYRG